MPDRTNILPEKLGTLKLDLEVLVNLGAIGQPQEEVHGSHRPVMCASTIAVGPHHMLVES